MTNNTAVEISTNIILNGIKLEIPNEFLNERIRKSFSSGSYETNEAQCIAKMIEQDEIILELGGGVGFVSAASGSNPKTTAIHVVEANPHLVPVIKRTHELNGVRSNVYHGVLGPRDGTSKFFLARSFIASSVSGTYGGKEIDVPMMSFQRILDEIRPTMMVVDIEGGEVDLFDWVLMPSVQRLFIELHDNVIGLEGVRKVFRNLDRCGLGYDPSLSTGIFVAFRRTVT